MKKNTRMKKPHTANNGNRCTTLKNYEKTNLLKRFKKVIFLKGNTDL